MNMKINKFKRIDKGCLIATFELESDVYGSNGQKLGKAFTDCSYFEKGEGGWINAASKMYESRDGTKKSYNMHRWDPELTAAITHEVRRKIRNGDYEEIQKAPPIKYPEPASDEEL